MNNYTMQLLIKSEFEKTSLDRAVMMSKGDMRDEAAAELATLRAQNAELQHLLFLVTTPLEKIADANAPTATRILADEALASIRAILAKYGGDNA